MPPFYRDSLAALLWLVSIAYCCIIPQQSNIILLLAGLVPCILCYAYLSLKGSVSSFKLIICVAVVARILAVWHFPNLSDDIYRFVWDGRLWHLGIHPFSVLPTDVVGSYANLPSELYDQLNSPNYYTIYPPIPQVIFWLSTHFTTVESSAFFMQLTHMCFDLGTLYFGFRLLLLMGLPKEKIYLYALHPLVIIELITNLHHESIVIFFLVLTLFALKKETTWLAGVALGGAVAAKILPALFFPLIFFYLRDKKKWTFFFSTAITSLVLFGPLLLDAEVISNLVESANLYMKKFEFNASIYYLLRSLGYLFYGFNLIHVIGPILTISTLVIIGSISIIPAKRAISFKELITLMMFSFMVYLFLSATVHPWYVATIIGLSIFTSYRSPLIRGLLIFLTYANYMGIEYREIMWIVFLEYAVVFGVLLYEIRKYSGIRLLKWS